MRARGLRWLRAAGGRGRNLAPDVLAERGRIDVHPNGGAPKELQIPVFRLQRYALA